MTRIIVIGGVTAGMSAAHQARRVSADASIQVFEKSDYVSGPCVVPYHLSQSSSGIQGLVSLTPKETSSSLNAAIFMQHAAQEIICQERAIIARDLVRGTSQSYFYDKLILATGGVPLEPPITGLETSGVFHLRNLGDGANIKQFLRDNEPRRATIVGSNYIALEIAESLSKQGIAVTILEPSNRFMPGWHGVISRAVESELTLNSVQVEVDSSVSAVERVADFGQSFISLTTSKGNRSTDMVILSLGVKPNTKLAQKAGIALGESGAIRVNDRMETNIPGIYAAGECAEVYHLVSHKNTYLPFGDTSSKQGGVAGANAAGGHDTFPGVVGSSGFQVFRLQVARTGLTDETEQIADLEPITTITTHKSVPYGFPDSQPITTLMVADRHSGRLLGAEMVGAATVGKRIDVLAACLYGNLTVQQIEKIDLVYAPPLSPLYDPILIAARSTRSKIQAASPGIKEGGFSNR